jgi:selenocysteine lyase/cysteine desulfurase
VSSSRFEAARQCVGDFLGAREDDVVVLTRNTTDALNLLARAIPDGTVVFLDLEHHANQFPWLNRPHRRVPVASTVDETLDRLDRALIEEPAVLLAVTGASNVTGDLTPVSAIVELAHSHRVRVVVDAAQLAPHRRFSLGECGADYVAVSGHKMYAPFGAGALVGRRDWLDSAPPYLLGGGAEVSGADGFRFPPAPHRHEAGTPNLLGAVALATACSVLAELGPGALAYHEQALLDHLEDELSSLPGVTRHRLWPDGERVGSVAFTVDGLPAGLVAAALGAEHGVAVRDGRFCAFPLTHRLGLDDGAVRASVGAGTTGHDVDRLVSAVRRLVGDGPAWRYALRDGRWDPVPDPRAVPDPPWW